MRNSLYAAVTVLLPLTAAAGSVWFPVVQDNIRFHSSVNSIKSSQVADLLSALNGYGLEPEEDVNGRAWNGLRSYNPLRHPTLFLIADFELGPSVRELTMNSNLRFKLDNDTQLEDELAAFKTRSVRRWPEAEGRMQAVDTGVGESDSESDDPAQAEERLREAVSLLEDEKLFEESKSADRAFLLEYYTFKGIVSEAANAPVDATPSTVYWIRLSSLRGLAAEYDADHKKTQRAAQLFSQLIGKATGVLESHPRALFMVIQEDGDRPAADATRTAADAPHARSRRDAASAHTNGGAPNSQPLAGDDSKPWNLAHQYDREYHIVFAITAFTMFIVVMGVLATSLSLWFMDPGRDSIIYRMTSQRMKID